MTHFLSRSVLAASAALVCGLVMAQPAHAQVINGGFETGDFTGWTVSPAGLGSVVTSYQGNDGSNPNGPVYTPVEGSYFATIMSGGGTGVYTTLSQTFATTAGSTLSGSAFFKANDYLPYNDDADVRIVQDGTVLFTSSVGAVGDFGNTPFTNFNYTFATTGLYTLEARIRDVGDGALPSTLGLDAVTVTAAVPEPGAVATGALLFGGLGLGMVRGRKRRKTAA